MVLWYIGKQNKLENVKQLKKDEMAHKNDPVSKVMKFTSNKD